MKTESDPKRDIEKEKLHKKVVVFGAAPQKLHFTR